MGHGPNIDGFRCDVFFWEFYLFGSSFVFFLEAVGSIPNRALGLRFEEEKIPFGRSFMRGMVGQHWGKVNKLFPPEKTVHIGFLYVPEISQIDTQNFTGNTWKIPVPLNHPFPKHDV